MTRPLSARLPSGIVRLALVGALAFVVGWAPSPASAQATGTLVGLVRDAASQRPLEAVQVFIQGTGIGALTNGAGRFLLLNVPAGEATLSAEIVGYKSSTQTVTVVAGQSAVANFSLEQTAIALDQIVVTGAGVATAKKKLGNTIATIDGSALSDKPIQNFSQMIAGREPGVVSLPSSGYTGEGARIRIRGSSSLSQLNEPIVYVDGIRVDNSAVNMGAGGQGNPSRLDDIPPESIERVEILKGAAAATLYGTEASNGVIQIFTKKGRSGAPRFSVQAEWTGISVPTNRILPIADFPRDQADVDQIQKRWGLSLQPYQTFQENIIPQLLTTGFNQTYSASVSGGSEAFQYFVSGRVANEDGPYDPQKNFPPAPGLTPSNDTNRRIQSTSSFTITPNSKIKIGVNTLYSDMKAETPENSNNIYGVFSSALMLQLRKATTADANGDGFSDNYYGNPAFATLRENMYDLTRDYSSHFAGSSNVSFTPSQSFRLDGTLGLDFTSDDDTDFRPYRWNVDNNSGSQPEGAKTSRQRRSKDITADLKGSYVKNLLGIDNTFLFGGQGYIKQNQSAGGTGEQFPGPGLEVVSALNINSGFESWTRNTQIGGYIQDQAGWHDWMFLTLGGRWDKNSAFGQSTPAAFYPKASISIVPSSGMEWNHSMISTFRIRGAIGKSGLQPGAFDKFTTFSPRTSEVGAGVQPFNLGNDALKPEVSTEWEAGTEMGLFNDRASLDVTYWNRVVNDALVARQFPVTGGFTRTQLDNIGQMKAHGFELNARGTVLQHSGFSLNVFANGAYLHEEISDMGGAPALKTGGSYPRYRNFLVQGYAPGAFFGAKTADLAIPLNIDGTCTEPTKEAALAYFSQPRDPSKFKPLAIGNSDFGKPDGTLASNNCNNAGLLYTYLGKPSPDWQGSFGFNLAKGPFELATLFEYKAGNYFVQDLSGMFRRANSVIGRNTPRAAELNAIMQNPASSAEDRLNAAVAWAREIEGLSPMSGMNGVFDASFVKWRELSLSYRMPTDLISRWGLSTATVTLGGRNIASFINSAYTGMDPEGNVLGRCNGGLDCNFLDSTEGWGIPIPARWTLSTRVTF